MHLPKRTAWILTWLSALALSAALQLTGEVGGDAVAGGGREAGRTADGAISKWVYRGPDGKLLYRTTPGGDRIMDFSHAGYMGGGVALPDVAVRRTVRPPAGDATGAIQAAIDEVEALPPEDGFRGAVLLAPGVFTCSRTIWISADGVVLRGSGSGAAEGPRTTLRLVGRPFDAIAIAKRGGRSDRADESTLTETRTTIADAYVPSGAMTFTVADAAGFAAGDYVAIRKPVTKAWVEFLQMHDLVRDGRPQTWIRTGTAIDTERRIGAISGRTIRLDVPLADSYDAQYLNPPGTAFVKIRAPALVSQVGVEHLHIESPPQAISHSRPHFTAMRIRAQDSWVRDVVSDETMNSFGVGGRRITLERVAVRRKALHQGSSRPAEFAPNGTQVLLDRCSVVADNVWYVATGGRQAGPIVILDCTFTGDGRAESHQRWSTGMLYDNCRAPDGGFDFRNRGSMGSGHGWSMGWGVAWNCVAKDYVIQNPPGALNWMIGCVGESRSRPRPFGTGPNLPEGIKDSHGTPVTPRSLYRAQLAERLGLGEERGRSRGGE